jgi:hypothetical protein
MFDNKDNNEDDENVYGVNNNNNISSSSISSMEDETFFQIQTILENHRINQDMKNDRND